MSDVYDCALHLLSKREHGAFELKQKLAQKGFSETDIEQVIAKCQQQGLQSDERFAENLCRNRVGKGYGPVRIEQELKHMQVEQETVEMALAGEENWLQHAIDVREKKFRGKPALNFKDIQKQKQFLRYRGFTNDIINQVFDALTL